MEKKSETSSRHSQISSSKMGEIFENSCNDALEFYSPELVAFEPYLSSDPDLNFTTKIDICENFDLFLLGGKNLPPEKFSVIFNDYLYKGVEMKEEKKQEEGEKIKDEKGQQITEKINEGGSQDLKEEEEIKENLEKPMKEESKAQTCQKIHYLGEVKSFAGDIFDENIKTSSMEKNVFPPKEVEIPEKIEPETEQTKSKSASNSSKVKKKKRTFTDMAHQCARNLIVFAENYGKLPDYYVSITNGDRSRLTPNVIERTIKKIKMAIHEQDLKNKVKNKEIKYVWIYVNMKCLTDHCQMKTFFDNKKSHIWTCFENHYLTKTKEAQQNLIALHNLKNKNEENIEEFKKRENIIMEIDQKINNLNVTMENLINSGSNLEFARAILDELELLPSDFLDKKIRKKTSEIIDICSTLDCVRMFLKENHN